MGEWEGSGRTRGTGNLWTFGENMLCHRWQESVNWSMTCAGPGDDTHHEQKVTGPPEPVYFVALPEWPYFHQVKRKSDYGGRGRGRRTLIFIEHLLCPECFAQSWLWINNKSVHDSSGRQFALDSAGQLFCPTPASAESWAGWGLINIINQLIGEAPWFSPTWSLFIQWKQSPLHGHFWSVFLHHDCYHPRAPIKSRDQTSSTNVAGVGTQGREEFPAIFCNIPQPEKSNFVHQLHNHLSQKRSTAREGPCWDSLCFAQGEPGRTRSSVSRMARHTTAAPRGPQAQRDIQGPPLAWNDSSIFWDKEEVWMGEEWGETWQ